MKKALSNYLLCKQLGRAGRNKRRGQDSNLRTSYPVTDLANRRFRPLSHLSRCLFFPCFNAPVFLELCMAFSRFGS